MRLIFAVLMLLVLFGCSQERKITFDDLQDIPATGETGTIHWQPEVGIEKQNLAPNFSVVSTSGQNITLSTYRGKPLIVYFWASWCPFCAQEFEKYKQRYPKYASNITFIAIDMDLKESMSLISRYENEKGTPGMIFAKGNEETLRAYGVSQTTQKYMIGSDGVILWKGSGVPDDEFMEKLLSGLANS